MRYKIRICPCPSYEVEKTESWLSDMAAKGMHLLHDGLFAGFASFELGTPAQVRYRLAAAKKNTSMWADDLGEPDPDEVELNACFNWEYVSKRGQFYVYRSYDAVGRELDSDPDVQTIALNYVRRRQRTNLISLIYWIVVYPILKIDGTLLLFAFSIGVNAFLLQMVITVLLIVVCLLKLIHLGKLKKKLETDGGLDHDKVWKKHPYAYFSRNVAIAMLIVLWVGVLLQGWSDTVLDIGVIPLSDFTGTVPFATLEDLPDTEVTAYKQTSGSFIHSSVRIGSDLIAPESYDWVENATLTLSDGSVLNAILMVEYHRMVSELLAKELLWEYLRDDRDSDGLLMLPCPDIGLDYVVAYNGEIGQQIVVLREGNTVVHANFFLLSGSMIPLETWVSTLAASIGD